MRAVPSISASRGGPGFAARRLRRSRRAYFKLCRRPEENIPYRQASGALAPVAERCSRAPDSVASHDHEVSFFDDFPGYVERRLPDGASGPPPGMIGGFVPWRIVLVRSDDAYAALQDFEAFPSGVLFELVLRLQDWNPDPSTRTHTVLRDPTSFRLGVRFSDGRAGASERFADQSRELRPNEVLLFPRAGSGHPHEYRQAFWLWPLPSAG